MRRVSTALLLFVLALFSAQNLHTSAELVETCPTIVREALASTSNLCQELGRNQACYGHIMLEAKPQPYVTVLEFNEEGDVASITDLRSIHLSGMDTVSGAWGISLMQLQANLPDSTPLNKNVTMLLFGNVEIDNPVSAESEMTIAAASRIQVYEFPARNADVIARFDAGESITVNGRLVDNSWLHVSLPDGAGWVNSRQVAETNDFENLRVVNAASQYYAPMQVFYFKSSDNDALCSEAPDSGILIQTPEGVGKISLLINEVDIEIGSTVYFQAEPDGDMFIRVVEGSATVSAFDTTFKALAGMQIVVPLDENLKASGPPTPPTAYDMADVRALPLSLFARRIVVSPPVDAEEAGMTTPVEETPVEDVVDPDQPEEPGSTTVPSTAVPEPTSSKEPKPTSISPTEPTDAPPTSVKPTTAPPTDVPPTSIQPTSVPPTSVLPTNIPPTSIQPTSVPPTSIPPTSVPPTSIPPTVIPPTSIPPTAVPPTDVPPTVEDRKVTICHKGNTIEISESSLPDHLAHGDTIGPCPPEGG